jgi:hypothetical protein
MLPAGIGQISGRAEMDADSRTVGTTTTPARSDGDRACAGLMRIPKNAY